MPDKRLIIDGHELEGITHFEKYADTRIMEVHVKAISPSTMFLEKLRYVSEAVGGSLNGLPFYCEPPRLMDGQLEEKVDPWLGGVSLGFKDNSDRRYVFSYNFL